ncbi:MAG TPA: PilT/PilU family type 4a pilus ATPase [Polyangiaceae bacterium]
MARVDSLLSILVQQGANELRLGTDREPKMLASGAPKRLAIPSTPEDTLRELLGEILTGEREQAMRAGGRVDVRYEAAGLGAFQVKLLARGDAAFDAVFLRETRPAPAASAAPSAAPPTPRAPLMPVARAPALAIVASPSFVELVATAAALRASDIHLIDGACPVVRVDGALRQLADAPVSLLPLLSLGAEQEERIARGHSVDLGLDVESVGRVRLHVFRTAEGTAASVRLLPSAAPSLASLHMPVPLDDLVTAPSGLVLVCGATGSGKSTTLAALAQEALRRRSIVLTTLEDPIEYGLAASHTSVVRRRQVGRDVADFASGLRDALREDPDVILVGEMRDPETIGLALTAAETGHLVLSSLHAPSAASAIERVVDVYPPQRQAQIRVQLADVLRAVVAQWLLPRARAAGRVPVVEVLRMTHAVGALVRDGRTAQIATALQSGRREGMITLERCLADRVQAGEVRIEDARALANDPASLSLYVGKPDDG